MIDTAERRRSAIDFGKGAIGTGMPIPSGLIDSAARCHILNLYPGIAAASDFFFFWRKRSTSTTSFRERVTPSTTWRKASNYPTDGFRKAVDVRDS